MKCVMPAASAPRGDTKPRHRVLGLQGHEFLLLKVEGQRGEACLIFDVPFP